MSKAFTSEETEDAPIVGRPIVRAAAGEERPITPEGHRALVERRAAAERERAELLAAALLDLDERRRELDHRLALLTATLDSVRVVEPPPFDGTARFGSHLRARWPDGREREVRLVGPDEADGKTAVSVLSPLGRGLLGATAGAEVEVERPDTPLVVRVLEVREP